MIAILMATYNGEKYISEAIESIINQTYQAWELIIIEDCSQDNTLEIIKRYLYDPRIKLYQNDRNIGIAGSRNKAIQMRADLENEDLNTFSNHLNEHWELSKKLDAGCTNTCIDQILISCEDLILGKMICGAGGGGFLQVILKKGVSKDEIKNRIQDVFQDSGIKVYDVTICE